MPGPRHEVLRNQDGWHEKDCEWAIVAFTFPEYFTERARTRVLQVLKIWYPDDYESITGKGLPP